MRKNDYIAVFDSGVGGISVLRQLLKALPNERYLYFGDSINAPYGVRTEEEVRQLQELNAAFGKKILADCVNRSKHFLFTSSRSYTLPGTDIKIGALKAYPMSVFLDKEQAQALAAEISESISEFFCNTAALALAPELFQDMSREDT